MNSVDYNLGGPMVCLVCQNFCTEEVMSCDAAFKKVLQNCSKYFHSSKTENNFKEIFNLPLSFKLDLLPAMCHPCFESTFRLSELVDQLEILQNSINDFLEIFSVEVLRRRTNEKSTLPMTEDTDINISHDDKNSDSDLIDNDVDPLLIKYPETPQFNHDDGDDGVNIEIKIEKVEPEISMKDFTSCDPSNLEYNQGEGGITAAGGGSNNKELCIKLERLQLPIIRRVQTVVLPCDPQIFRKRRSSDEDPEVKPENLEESDSSTSDDEIISPALKKPSAKQPQKRMKSHSCSICGKRLAPTSSFTRHLRTHTGEKPHKCPHCEMTFVQHFSLKAHIRTHTGEKNYKCPSCTQAFARRDHLQRHLRHHRGEKYKCPSCPLAYATTYGLARHMERHKKHRCTKCGKEFNEISLFEEHRQTHIDEVRFESSDCEMSFKRKSARSTLKRKHIGEKPHRCSHCSAAFLRKEHLDRHARIHTGEKPFKCQHCGKTFAQRYHCTAHVKRRHMSPQ